jgi:hypothetical protein
MKIDIIFCARLCVTKTKQREDNIREGKNEMIKRDIRKEKD